MTLFQLQNLGNITWGEKLTMYGEQVRIWMEVVVACFNVLSQICLEKWRKTLYISNRIYTGIVCASCESKLFIHTVTGKNVPLYTLYLLQMRLNH